METYFPKSPDEFLDLFFRRKKLFLVPFVSVVLIVILVYPFLPRLYKSTAFILMEEDAISNPLDGSQSRSSRLSQRVKAIEAQVLSFNNINELIQRSDMAIDAQSPDDRARFAEKVRAQIEIDQEGKNLITVSFHHKDPKTAKNFANLLAENLVQKNLDIESYIGQKRIELIENQLHIYKEKLETSETSFMANKIKSDLDELIKKRDLMKRQYIPTESQSRTELVEAESELNRLLIDAKPEHPLVKELESRVKRLRARVQREMDSDATPGGNPDNPVFQEALVNKIKMVKELDIQISSLRKKLRDLQSGEAQRLEVTPQELLAMERDKAVNEDIYRSLLVKLENAQINKRMSATGGGDTLEILERARAPRLPSKPNPLKTAAMGFGLAIVAGLAAMFGREFFDSSLRGVKDAKTYFNFTFLGYTPKFGAEEEKKEVKVKANGANGASSNGTAGFQYPSLVALNTPFSREAEQFRIIRTNLFNERRKHSFKTILFTSSWEGEGKTTTVANLGASIAHETGKKAIVVDTDLRRGTLSTVFNFSREKGLRDILEGKAELDDVIKRPKNLNLDLISSGEPLPNPTSLLDQENKMMDLLNTLKSRYDLILLDAPPVMHIADIPILSNYVDGVILVIKSLETRREQAQTVQYTLRQLVQDRLLGYILTHLENHIPVYARAYHPDAIY